MLEPWYRNFIDNMATVQFDHRLLAATLALLVPWFVWRAHRTADSAASGTARGGPVPRGARHPDRTGYRDVAAGRAAGACRRASGRRGAAVRRGVERKPTRCADACGAIRWQRCVPLLSPTRRTLRRPAAFAFRGISGDDCRLACASRQPWPNRTNSTNRSSETEYDALEAFFGSNAVPQDCMDLEMLDGFLTAIVSGPELIQPSEWLPVVWSDSQRSVVAGIRGQ